MTNLQGLIERLEKAEGPDRELDLAVLCAVPAPACGWIGVWPDHLTWDSLDAGHRAPPLTASIDAAVAFAERVFPNVMWRVGFDPDCGWMKGEIVTQAPACHTGRGWSAHAPIAILISTLRALMGKEGGDG